MTPKIRKRVIFSVAALAVAAAAVFYFAVDPETARWVPKCFVYQLTGFKCAGCGSQRAIHSLLHGDFSSAWSLNAFLVVMVPVLAFLLWLEFRREAFPKLYRKIHSPLVIAIFGVAVVLWTVGRNIF